MAKQLIHIGLAVATVGDGREYPAGSPPGGLVPGRANIINIAACCGEAYTYDQNIIPASGVYGDSPFWAKHPEELEKLKRQAVPLQEALASFRTWLKQFQGSLVACSSSVDFWHLLEAFFQTGKDFPFGSTGLIDTNTLAMIQKGKQRPTRVSDGVAPLQVAKARWSAMTQGQMPPFGERPFRPKPRKKTVFTEAGPGQQVVEVAVPTPATRRATQWGVTDAQLRARDELVAAQRRLDQQQTAVRLQQAARNMRFLTADLNGVPVRVDRTRITHVGDTEPEF